MLRFVFCITLALLLLSSAAHAEKKTFGLGVVIVDPTGLTFEYIYSKNMAAVASIGWGKDAVSLYIDNLWMRPNLVKVDKRPIAFYYGVGLRWLNRYDNSDIGIRVPLGLQHIFREVPIQIFFEVAPTLNLVPSSSFDLDLALGARYFF